MKVQELFKNVGYNEAKAHLENTLHIKVKEYDDFVVLNYDQIFSPKTDEMVMECRSLKLSYDGEVVSRAFPRFFNYGEAPEITGKFQWKDSKHFSKCDGSLIPIYWNPFAHKWEISTRGTAFAEAEQTFFPSFREAVLSDALEMDEEQFQCFFDGMDTNITYAFEYVSKYNRIVTPYASAGLILIGCFNNASGEEYDINVMFNKFKDHPKFSLPEQFEFKDEDELKRALENLTDLKEGFVSLDVNGLRIKHKNLLYLKLHAAKGDTGFTLKKISEIVALGEEAEVLRYFPEYENDFRDMINKREYLFTDIKIDWEMHRFIETQKDFAIQVKDKPYSGILFSMRKGKSFEETWNDLRLETKATLILEK